MQFSWLAAQNRGKLGEAVVLWEEPHCECCPNSVHARNLAAARTASSEREHFDRVIGVTVPQERIIVSQCLSPTNYGASFRRVVTDFICRTNLLLTRSDGKMTFCEVDSNVLDICDYWHTDSDSVRLKFCAPFLLKFWLCWWCRCTFIVDTHCRHTYFCEANQYWK